MKASKDERVSSDDITMYKTACVQRITNYTGLSKKEIDRTLKLYATILSGFFDEPMNLDKSSLEMNHDEYQVLKELSKQFATQLGIDIDDKKEEDKLIHFQWKY